MDIVIKCNTGMSEDLSQLRPIQGNLKDLTDANYLRLKNKMLDEGFIAPFFVWLKPDGQKFILGGHQRQRTLTKMIEEGYKIPSEFPIVKVEAESHHDACKKVLSLTSQYGTITKQGLYEFVEQNEIEKDELDTFNFDAFPMQSFCMEYYEATKMEDKDFSDKNKEINTDNFGNDLEHTCPRCGMSFNE